MATDQGPVVQSALLRSELVRLRKDSGFTQEQVAKALDWSPSKLIRVEGGRSAITKVDLDALLTKYGVTSESSRDRLQSLNRGARERQWWSDYRGELPAAFLEFVGYEAGASAVRSFESGFVPAMLQTPEYAKVLTANSADAVISGMIVKVRMQRQAELVKRSEPPRQYFVIDEAVVRRHIGIAQDPGVMPAQLRHIAAITEASDLVTVRVIPFSAGAHVGLGGPFTLLEFDGGLADLLYLESGRGSELVSAGGDQRVAKYADDFESLLESSLTVGESVEFIRKVAEEMS
jgi:transcriptional regulator with XRE-family HTH domain